MSLVLFSNNPLLRAACAPSYPPGERVWRVRDGSALQVLQEARDKIHTGWKLVNHPLYGNYRPYQQPYRTILLESACGQWPSARPAAQSAPPVPDIMSLHLIEEALTVYREAPFILTPEATPPIMRRDCAELDLALMRLPLEKAGWPEFIAAEPDIALG